MKFSTSDKTVEADRSNSNYIVHIFELSQPLYNLGNEVDTSDISVEVDIAGREEEVDI